MDKLSPRECDYTMCDCDEYEGPHDPTMRCVLRAKLDERKDCAKALRTLGKAVWFSNTATMPLGMSFAAAITGAVSQAVLELAACHLERST